MLVLSNQSSTSLVFMHQENHHTCLWCSEVGSLIQSKSMLGFSVSTKSQELLSVCLIFCLFETCRPAFIKRIIRRKAHTFENKLARLEQPKSRSVFAPDPSFDSVYWAVKPGLFYYFPRFASLAVLLFPSLEW